MFFEGMEVSLLYFVAFIKISEFLHILTRNKD